VLRSVMNDIQRQVKSLYCAANKLQSTFDQCSPAVKNTSFRSCCMPMYAHQLWSKYTQTSIKLLRTAYNQVFAHTKLAIVSRLLMPY